MSWVPVAEATVTLPFFLVAAVTEVRHQEKGLHSLPAHRNKLEESAVKQQLLNTPFCNTKRSEIRFSCLVNTVTQT